MFKKMFSFLPLIVLFAFSMGFAQEKKPVIFIENFANTGKGSDSAGENLERSLRRAVDITHKFDIVTPKTMAAYLKKMKIKNVKPTDVNAKYIETNFAKMGIDEVLYGTFTPFNNGEGVEFHVIAAIPSINKVIYDKVFRSSTDADLFDTLDRMGLDLAGALAGRSFGYGVLSVNNSYSGSDIFIDGVKSGRDRLSQNTVIAGTQRKVEIVSKDGKKLFSRDFEMLDRGYFEVNFNYDETVEVIDESKATNRMKKQDYLRRSGGGGGLRTGPVFTFGGGGFLWLGWFLDTDHFGAELDFTVLPRIPNYIYDWYIGLAPYIRFYAFQQSEAWFNLYARLGAVTFWGFDLGFFDYSPFIYFGLGFQIMPNWSFIPPFMRHWKLFVEGGTFQTLEIFYKNFATADNTRSTYMKPYNNIGYGMLTVGLKLPF